MPAEAVRPRILVTGASGQVGEALLQTLAPLGEVVAPGREQLDLTDPDSIRRVMREVRPRWVVNPAAHTAVDKAESEPELAFAINAAAPQLLAEEAIRIGAALVHYSTDYVFDGTKATPYVETDPVAPVNVYGASKLAGEQALAASGVPFLVFRTSWVYGATGKNFVRSMLRFARERELLKVVADQHGGPTWSFELARMTAHVIGQLEAAAAQQACPLAEAVQPLAGIYHATGSGQTTWCGFAAQAIADLQQLEPAARLARVEPITTAEYPTPARRPLNSRLDCGKLQRSFAWKMPDWQQSLQQVVAKLTS
jgi:dTDP-4-dehydrorhamnose reductase